MNNESLWLSEDSTYLWSGALKSLGEPEGKLTPITCFTAFVVGLFLNVFSISVSASDFCTFTACVIFYVVNGIGIILNASLIYCCSTKCLFIGESGVHLMVSNGQTALQRCSNAARRKERWKNSTNSSYSLNSLMTQFTNIQGFLTFQPVASQSGSVDGITKGFVIVSKMTYEMLAKFFEMLGLQH